MTELGFANESLVVLLCVVAVMMAVLYGTLYGFLESPKKFWLAAGLMIAHAVYGIFAIYTGDMKLDALPFILYVIVFGFQYFKSSRDYVANVEKAKKDEQRNEILDAFRR